MNSFGNALLELLLLIANIIPCLYIWVLRKQCKILNLFRCHI